MSSLGHRTMARTVDTPLFIHNHLTWTITKVRETPSKKLGYLSLFYVP
jgi:hypothetical protein